MAEQESSDCKLVTRLEELLPKHTRYSDVYGICYLAYKMQGRPLGEWRRQREWFNAVPIKHELRDYLADLLDSVDVQALYELAQRIPNDVLKAHLLSSFCDNRFRVSVAVSLPDLPIRLALDILDAQPGETVANLNSGDGSFVVRAAEGEREARCLGVDADEHLLLCSLMRADVAGVSIEVAQNTALGWFDDKGKPSVDKMLLVNSPGMSLARMVESSSAAREALEAYPDLSDKGAAFWMSAQLVMDSLKAEGKGIAFSVTDPLILGSSLASRQRFVESGWVETVIQLPMGVFYPLQKVRVSLVVLSHGNHGVRVVDASDIQADNGWENWGTLTTARFPSDALMEIQKRLSCDCERSRLLSLKDLRENGYRLIL